jgi:hypothetical protein
VEHINVPWPILQALLSNVSQAWKKTDQKLQNLFCFTVSDEEMKFYNSKHGRLETLLGGDPR